MSTKRFVCHISSIRLDHFLTICLSTSRNRVTELIKNAFVSVNNIKQTKAGLKLKENDAVTIQLPELKKSESKEVDFDIPIVFEDNDILIINKPPHLTVHPAPSVKEPTLVDWLKSKNISLSTLSGEERNGIVHRIDKDTSGALIVAKNNAAHMNLAKQLENRTLGRYYLALIDYPLKNDTIVDKPVGRNPKNRLKMAIVQNGRAAKSAFCSLLTNEKEEIELIAAKLFTGRTHQIRVHLSALGRHILGDDLYGFKSQKDKINRVMLHAYCLYLIHPASGEKMIFTAPLYDDFEEQLLKFFTKEKLNETLCADAITLRLNTTS
ncbi:MAG: RluA family pseudouridine synthase [Campylobacteraceae bacterium]|jgi:23S rRNA pseudouridine1911/1915/1917 synthase|nr:RluA family pseudouridine synthase [Campylobacteraceae bacterium]